MFSLLKLSLLNLVGFEYALLSQLVQYVKVELVNRDRLDSVWLPNLPGGTTAPRVACDLLRGWITNYIKQFFGV